MESSSHEEREVRAARNQSLFRAVNEKVRDLNEAMSALTHTFTISCECADRNCIGQLDIDPDDYLAVRSEPRRFVVLPGHVYPDLERVVAELDGYVVLEKFGFAGDLAEALDPRNETVSEPSS